MTYDPMLEDVKICLGVTGTYQDATINGYIVEVKAFLIDAGASPDSITTGVVVRGVSDLWNYGSGEGKFSDYFMQRAAQLAYKG